MHLEPEESKWDKAMPWIWATLFNLGIWLLIANAVMDVVR